MTRCALVLGAGGHAAIAWEIGILAGLADLGIDVRDADTIIGTSAGSVVGAQITSGLTLEELFQRQVDPNLQTMESTPSIDFARWRADYMRAKGESDDALVVLRRVGALARQLPPDAQQVRRKMIAARLPLHTWPERRLLVVAVDLDSAERRAFDRSSGVELIDAVMASGAVPGIWPPVAIGDHRYMDGGAYSIDNADLAIGCDRVLIIPLQAGVPPLCVASLDAAVDTLKRNGARVEIIHPDEESQNAFNSFRGNLLDPTVRTGAAHAGREQGRREATLHLGPLWK